MIDGDIDCDALSEATSEAFELELLNRRCPLNYREKGTFYIGDSIQGQSGPLLLRNQFTTVDAVILFDPMKAAARLVEKVCGVQGRGLGGLETRLESPNIKFVRDLDGLRIIVYRDPGDDVLKIRTDVLVASIARAWSETQGEQL